MGDLIDIWSLRCGIYWPQEHFDVIQKLLRKARKGSRIVCIPGNHDEFLRGASGDITIQKHALHTTADGRRIFILHGHELATVVQNTGGSRYSATFLTKSSSPSTVGSWRRHAGLMFPHPLI